MRPLTDAPRVSRIHIVGGPGSGKTTLATRLGQLLAAPVHDLDTIAYEGGVGRKRDLALRRADVQRIATAPCWVTEGIYLWWCGPLAERAHQIVWLDIPWRVAVYRILRRHILLTLAGTNRHPGMQKLARFAWHTRHYYLADPQMEPVITDDNDDGAITCAATQAWLKRYGVKVMRCRTKRDLDAVVAKTRAHAARAT
jgi:hypothetical protein